MSSSKSKKPKKPYLKLISKLKAFPSTLARWTFLMLALLVMQAHVSYASEAFYIQNYDVDIQLNANGSFDVTESITVYFNEQRRGIIRSIPYRYKVSNVSGERAQRRQSGPYYEVLYKDIEVPGNRHQVFKEDSYMHIRIGDPDVYLKGAKTYVIKYRVWGALNQFSKQQEFSWNIIGTQWDTYIENASFNIKLPNAVSLGAQDVLCYTGRRGSKDQHAEYTVEPKRISGRSTQKLRAFEGISLAIRLPVDYFESTDIPVSALADNYYVKAHNLTAEVQPDASIVVREVFEVEFVKETGIFGRVFAVNPIRSSHRDQYAFIDLSTLFITDKNEDLQFHVGRNNKGDFISISKRNGAFSGTHTFDLRYTIWGAITPDHTGIIDVFNTDRNEPLVSSAFEVRSPGSIRQWYISDEIGVNKEGAFQVTEKDSKGISANLKKATIQNAAYRLRFEADEAFVQFDKVPMKVFGEHFIVDQMITDVRVKGNGVTEVSHDFYLDFVYPNLEHTFQPYIQRRYSGDNDIELPRYNLLSSTHRPEIFNIQWSDSANYVLKKHGRQFDIVRKRRAGGYFENPFSYSYEAYGLLDNEGGKRQLNYPVVYDLDEPVRNSRVNITFDKASSLASVGYSARISDSDDGRVTWNERKNALTATTDGYLKPGEELFVDVLFPKKWSRSNTQKWLQIIYHNNIWLFTACILFIVLYIIWYFFGRDINHPKVVHYRPPSDVTPAEAGLLWDDKLHKKDLISLIYYWAANGHLKIKEIGSEKKPDFELTKLKPLGGAAKPFETIMFDGLFADGDMVDISDLRNSYYSTMSKAHKSLEKYGREHQFYTPGSRGFGCLLKGIAVILFLAGLVFLGFAFVSGNFSIAVPLLAAGIFTFIFGWIMPQKGPFGAKKYHEILGFKEFIDRAEIDRLRMLIDEEPTYFERTIPYAIVFGLGKKWAEKFKDLTIPAPDWYEGTSNDPFTTIYFTNAMMRSMRRMNTDMNYRQYSSGDHSSWSGGGGSSFGGGFSGGGGFGGGGGSSW